VVDSQKLKNNILHPFYLVYLSMDGKTVLKATNNKLALDYFRKLSMGNDAVIPELIAAFDKETSGDKKVEKYVKLLEKAKKEVIGVQEEVGLDSLATEGGTTLFSKKTKEDDELELVSYLIIK